MSQITKSCRTQQNPAARRAGLPPARCSLLKSNSGVGSHLPEPQLRKLVERRLALRNLDTDPISSRPKMCTLGNFAQTISVAIAHIQAFFRGLGWTMTVADRRQNMGQEARIDLERFHNSRALSSIQQRVIFLRKMPLAGAGFGVQQLWNGCSRQFSRLFPCWAR